MPILFFLQNYDKTKNLLPVFIFMLFMFGLETHAQVLTNRNKLIHFANTQKAIEIIRKQKALSAASIQGYTLRKDSAGVTIELQFIDKRGNPQYYIANNANSAKTISTDKVFSGGGAGLSLDGSGVTTHEWDAGSVRTTHQEFGGRAHNNDAASIHYHSTHVAGTIIASGVTASAKGMAPAASLESHDWNYDGSEMAMEAANGMLVSNHSYGFLRGWNGTTWWGDTTVSNDEDYKFGFYDETSQRWDEIAFDAPYYLIVKSAGNDRNDSGTGHPPDGPYDCIDQLGISKNILTVGAVNDITSGSTKPSDVVMTSFSSWGPADDGRIKPDIVANGSSLYSTYSINDSAYTSLSGTSMSAPSVTGSIALLIQQYENIFGSGKKMRAATMKALIINTADEAGSYNGPDYSFGWGLMNTEKAALKIAEDDTTDVIYEGMLENGDSCLINIVVNDTNSMRFTLVWTDPVGNIPPTIVDPPDTILVNDLNLTVTDTNTSTVYYPWKLDKDNPSDSAVKGENNVDNVEQVDIAKADSGHVYQVKINHNGTLQNNRQAFSLVMDGGLTTNRAPSSGFYASILSPREGQQVDFFDASFNIPTSWSWSFSPSTVSYVNGTTAASQNPQVQFSDTGSYSVSLSVQNSYGSDTLIKSGYISVVDAPTGYCEAYSHNSWGYINRVKLCKIDNTSTATNVGDADPNDKYYEDWTSVETKVLRGKTHKLTISNSVTDATYTPYLDVFVWVDWNRDGDFWDDGEEMIVDKNNGGGGTFDFAVPDTAVLGKTRMRIRTHYYDDYGVYPCGNTDYGEVEDYTLDVTDSTVATWTGSSDTLWSNTANWDTGTIPDCTTEITIPSTATNFPYIPVSDTVECYSVTLETGAKITVKGMLKVYGW